MWHEFLDNTKFLKELYEKIPDLINVQINNVCLNESGNRIKIIIELPRYADYPPKKWSNNNTISIEMDFFGIQSINISSIANSYHGDFKINKLDNGFLEVDIKGTLNLNIIVELGYVQRLEGYVR